MRLTRCGSEVCIAAVGTKRARVNLRACPANRGVVGFSATDIRRLDDRSVHNHHTDYVRICSWPWLRAKSRDLTIDGDRLRQTGLCRRIGKLLAAFSARECTNYFTHAGY
jgi:hypothetical protein